MSTETNRLGELGRATAVRLVVGVRYERRPYRDLVEPFGPGTHGVKRLIDGGEDAFSRRVDFGKSFLIARCSEVAPSYPRRGSRPLFLE